MTVSRKLIWLCLFSIVGVAGFSIRSNVTESRLDAESNDIAIRTGHQVLLLAQALQDDPKPVALDEDLGRVVPDAENLADIRQLLQNYAYVYTPNQGTIFQVKIRRDDFPSEIRARLPFGWSITSEKFEVGLLMEEDWKGLVPEDDGVEE